jgi:hypothetical protein
LTANAPIDASSAVTEVPVNRIAARRPVGIAYTLAAKSAVCVKEAETPPKEMVSVTTTSRLAFGVSVNERAWRAGRATHEAPGDVAVTVADAGTESATHVIFAPFPTVTTSGSTAHEAVAGNEYTADAGITSETLVRVFANVNATLCCPAVV